MNTFQISLIIAVVAWTLYAATRPIAMSRMRETMEIKRFTGKTVTSWTVSVNGLH